MPFWRKLFPLVFLFAMVDGFIGNWSYPARLPLLYKDFLVIILYANFLMKVEVGPWMSAFMSRFGNVPFALLMLFFLIGILQVFNPLSANPFVGILGLKITYLYIPLAFVAYVYFDSYKTVYSFLKKIVYFSMLINAFGLYQFVRGPGFLINTFGPGFERAVTMAALEGAKLESFVRIIGTFASTGQYTAFLIMNIMLTFGLMFSAETTRDKRIAYAAQMLNFFALLGTGSRGGVLFLGVEIVVFALISKYARPVISAVFVIGLSLYLGFSWLGASVMARFDTLKDVRTIRQRTYVATTGIFSSYLEKYPMGLGLGAASIASRHMTGGTLKNVILVENFPSKLQVETGMPGVCIFYLFLFSLYGKWAKWVGDIGRDSVLCAVLTAYGLTFLTINSFIGILDSPPGYFFIWMIIGLLVRMTTLADEDYQRSLEQPTQD